MVRSGATDIGNLPVIECARQGLTRVPGVGVACHGPVRSILLVTKRPLDRIATLAADTSSRTSVALARIVLARRYGARPGFVPHAPDLDAMLEQHDAALLIGDPALRVNPEELPYESLDLGGAWVEMTDLPMVFAMWAGPRDVVTSDVAAALQESCRYGRQRIDEVIAVDGVQRGFPEDLARDYLTRHIVNELTERDEAGLQLYLRYAREEGLAPERDEAA